jgi:hypothetical protein
MRIVGVTATIHLSIGSPPLITTASNYRFMPEKGPLRL